MKRALYVLSIVILVATMCFAVSCVGSGATNHQLESYGFSYDNIVEIGYISSVSDDGGTPYGNTVHILKKGKSSEENKIIQAAAQAWQELQSKATFKQMKKLPWTIVCGGAGELVCVFKDGDSVRLHKDELYNFKINNGKTCRLSDEDLIYFNNLRKVYGEIISPEYSVLSPLSPAEISEIKLKSFDFSVDNISEVRLERGCPLSTYSVKSDESQNSQEIISQVADVWAKFQRDAILTDEIYGDDHAIVGCFNKFVCVFADGRIAEIYRDGNTNYVLNGSAPFQFEDENVYEVLFDIVEILEKEEYKIGG